MAYPYSAMVDTTMKLAHLLSPIATHSVAGLLFALGLVEYLICHPEAFTPGVFTQCACGLLTAIGGISAAATYTKHKFANAKPTQPVEAQPAPVSTPSQDTPHEH